MACSVANFTSNELHKPRITMVRFVADEPLISTGFYRWAPGEPNNLFQEDCGSIYTNGGLNDYNCDTQAPFICEQDLVGDR
jgi:hypothetical protein